MSKSDSGGVWQKMGQDFEKKHGRQWKPVVRMYKALYGHSDAGALWERYCHKVLLRLGFTPIPNWGTCYTHKDDDLFLTVYVDDMKLIKADVQELQDELDKLYKWAEDNNMKFNGKLVVVWFRTDLRLDDNPVLAEAQKLIERGKASTMLPVKILDIYGISWKFRRSS